MPAFQAALRPSRWLYALAVTWYAALLLAVLCYAGDVWRWPWLAVLAAAVWHTHRHWRQGRIERIAVDARGQASIWPADGVAREAQLLPGSWCSRHMLILHWDCDGRVWRHCVLADMTDAAAFRRLRVWARWMQTRAD